MIHRFGPLTFDPAAGSLSGPDGASVIGQRAAALLQALIDAEGRPVPKSALLDAAWPGMVVEEANLAVQIGALRKALGPGPDGREWIVTVPRLGYRLLREAAAAPKAEPALPIIAVMPFLNLSGDPEQDYFADGMVEDIITALSRFKSFAVVARNSSFVYKGRTVDVREVARELGVRYLLEGSVRRAGNSVRINAQLVDGADAVHLWAQSYSGDLGDIFDFQDRITESVVGLVEPNIRRAEIEHSRRDRPGSLDAYDLYLRAIPDVYRSRPESVARAIGLLESAIALDPAFAPALAMAAHAYLLRVVFQFDGADDADAQRGAELARAALDLSREDAMVVAFGAFFLLHVAREHETGMSLLRLAVSENPNSAEVLDLAGVGALLVGDLGEAADYLQRSLRLDPNSASVHWQLTGMAHIRMAEGRYAEALDWATRSQAVNADYEPTHWMLIAANAQLGRMNEAHRHLDDFRKLVPDITIARIAAGQPDKYPDRLAAILEGLRLAGLAEA